MMDNSQEPNFGPDQVLPASSLKGWDAASAVQLQMTSSGPQSVAPVSVYTLLYRTADQYPLQQALAVKRDGQWVYWSYQDYFKECCIVAKAFIKLGLDRFHGVCIMGFNSPEWLIANFGCIFAGGISTGVYTTNSTDACRHLAHDCRAQIAVLENAIYVEKFMAVKHLLPHLKVIVQWSGTIKADGVISWEQLMASGRQETDDALQARLKLQAVNQCCTLIYTSGTTGPPKGVMCSQDSLTWAGSQYAMWFKLKPCCESIVSYLPFSHLAAQMTELYVSIPAASTIYFAQPDALKGSLVKTLVEVQPTNFLAIPRVWEKMHEKMRDVAGKSSYALQQVADWAKHQGLEHYRAMMEGREQTWYAWLQYRLARVLVLDRVKAALGLGNAIRLASGTAPLSVEVLEYFLSLDMPIMECYGLSESLSLGAVNEILPGGFKCNSVGKVMWLTSLKLRESPMANEKQEGEGEICMKGRNVFMGYLNLPDKTNETILDDGWMVTGDLGWIDTDGFLRISGRVKELVITAGGENIPPVLIEEVIKKELAILSNAMLIGDKRKFLTILLTVKCDVDPDSGAPLDTLTPPVVAWCADQGLAVTTVTELKREIDNNRQGVVAKAVQAAIDRYNTHHAISNAQKVQRWTLLSHDFSQHTGELNNTLKLKRSVVAEMYADIIDRLYGDSYP